MTLKIITTALLTRFAKMVGEANALTRAEDQQPYLHEWRDRYIGKTPVVLRPGSTDEVSRILALANEHSIGVVPQGGNTGLVGGQIPSIEGNEIVLSLSRLNKIRKLDAGGGTMIVDGGVTLAAVQAAATNAGRLFPLSLASEGTAQIGGLLATNAGGTAVLAHGSARNLCLGLEAVFADGRIWNGLRTLKKDNTGYDLRDLLIGSEGTLGIITAAVLRTVPRPLESATAIIALKSPEAVRDLFQLAETAAGPSLTAFEFWSRRPMEFALTHIPKTRDPFREPHAWYALLEISANDAKGQSAVCLETVLATALEHTVIVDAALAATTQQAQDFWRLRESMSEAQKGEGGSIKHDISVPIALIPEFLTRAATVVENVCPGARPVPFGHFGDGNLHYNVSQPVGMDKAAFVELWGPMSAAIHDLVSEMDGSISAEHGIGQMKRDALVRYKSAIELDMMRAIKKAFDPNGILNPGKVL